MKFALAVLALAGVASAGKPQLSISVRDGKYDGLDGLDPTLTWEDSQRSGDMDISYGIKASARPTSDIASLPKSIWGKISTDVSGWDVSAKAETDGLNFDSPNLEIEADNADADLNVQLTASTGGAFNLKTVEATKGIDTKGARVTVNPRYNMETDASDVVVNYNSGDTNVKVTASADNQEVSFSQQIDKENRIAPTVNSNGDISLEWERRLSADSSLTANLKPNDNINVEWKDSDWTANIRMPIDGTDIKGADVSIKRDVELL